MIYIENAIENPITVRCESILRAVVGFIIGVKFNFREQKICRAYLN